MQDTTFISKLEDVREFFLLLYPRLYRHVAAATGAPAADVEDIVGDVILNVWKDREQFRGESALLSWVHSIVRNRISEFRRKDAVRRDPERIRRAIAGVGSIDIPPDLLQDAELKARVRTALAALEESYAGLLTRRYFHGESVRAIACDLGETEDAVECRLRRARESFRQHLESGGLHDAL